MDRISSLAAATNIVAAGLWSAWLCCRWCLRCVEAYAVMSNHHVIGSRSSIRDAAIKLGRRFLQGIMHDTSLTPTHHPNPTLKRLHSACNDTKVNAWRYKSLYVMCRQKFVMSLLLVPHCKVSRCKSICGKSYSVWPRGLLLIRCWPGSRHARPRPARN